MISKKNINYLRRTPLDRKLSTTIARILVIDHISGQTKVRHLDNILLPHQTIPGCQVAVNVIIFFKICHATTHLPYRNDNYVFALWWTFNNLQTNKTISKWKLIFPSNNIPLWIVPIGVCTKANHWHHRFFKHNTYL